ncbi:MAG TPA: acireductone synthase [Bacteriovoracaceae bacterium]|nr:acireductone synthase [Bacteriovoracaceae bacterium]
MIKLFLFDIEGTTTDIRFVHQILFPYSQLHLESYVLHHQTHPVVTAAIQKVRDTVWQEESRQLGLYQVIEKLASWIKSDRKHSALKDIQGLIWDIGYSKNDFKGHVYPDVKPFFKKILSTGAKIGIYSSGSVHAQKLIFGYSVEGDLSPMISHYFDTSVGGKRDPSSYQKLAQELSLTPAQIHFFSDIAEELKAAETAGMGVTQVLRPGTMSSEFETVNTFDDFLEYI